MNNINNKKQYNCPDCKLDVNDCNGCPRVMDMSTNTFKQNKCNYDYYYLSYIPEPCKYCANHPSNGGSGICNCILGVKSTLCQYPSGGGGGRGRIN